MNKDMENIVMTVLAGYGLMYLLDSLLTRKRERPTVVVVAGEDAVDFLAQLTASDVEVQE